MRLNSKPLAIIIVALMFGGNFFSSALGWWNSGSSKKAAVYSGGRYAGYPNPADIRGSYTFGDIEANFGVPAPLLAQAFCVQSGDPAIFTVKNLEAIYLDSPQEVGTGSVRLFVAFYLGLPVDLSSDAYLPEAAAITLYTQGLSAEYKAYLESHVIPDRESGAALFDGQGEPATTHELSGPEEGSIKGKTTFAELLKWGLKRETIAEVLGMPMPEAMGMTVRDFCWQNDLEYGNIRQALQAKLDISR
jgi:hypothetical protein